jgi:hypothetical protein
MFYISYLFLAKKWWNPLPAPSSSIARPAWSIHSRTLASGG